MKRKHSKSRGYTAVEVLSAMTLFAIGAAGVIGMQKAAVQGGTDARRFDIGSNLANEWLHRLQRDSNFWTLPNNSDRIHTDLDKTQWLKDLNTPNPACTGSNYCMPALPSLAGSDSAAFDVLGADAISGSGDHFFCAQYRLNWVANPRSTARGQCSAATTDEPCPTGLLRAEVRVFWSRLENAPIADCSSVANPGATPNNYHFVYAATLIRQNSNYPGSGL